MGFESVELAEALPKVIRFAAFTHMGVSEKSVPQSTQWLMIIIPIKWL